MNIILLNSQNAGVIDDKHQYVTVGPNCWGIGRTAKESLKNCKANAPHGRTVIFHTRVAPLDGFGIDPVDGAIAYSAKHNAAACPVCSVGKNIIVEVQ